MRTTAGRATEEGWRSCSSWGRSLRPLAVIGVHEHRGDWEWWQFAVPACSAVAMVAIAVADNRRWIPYYTKADIACRGLSVAVAVFAVIVNA